MDVNWNKFPNINLGCFGWFLIFIEIISLSLLDKGYVGLIFQVCNSFRSNLRPLLIISKIYLSLLYSYQFLLKYLKLSPANFITSLSSSIGISWKGSGPTDFNVYFLGYLSLWLLLHCFWYWPNLFRYPYWFLYSGFWGNRCKVFELLKEELHDWKELLDVEKSFIFAVTFIILYCTHFLINNPFLNITPKIV